MIVVGHRAADEWICAIRSPCDSAIEQANPDVIIHAGAMSSAEAVRRQPALGWNVNVRATEVLSRVGRREPAATLVHFHRSCFRRHEILVSRGRSRPFRSWNMAGPSWPRRRSCSRTAGAWSSGSACSMVRRARAEPAYFDQAIAALRSGTPQAFFEDEFRTPLDYRDGRDDPGPAGRVGCDRDHSCRGAGKSQPLRVDAAGRERRSGARRDLVRAQSPGRRPADEPRPADVSLDTSVLRAVCRDFVLADDRRGPGVQSAKLRGPPGPG